MDKETEIAGLKLLEIPTIIVLILIAFILLGIFDAWVTQKLYNWFLLPLRTPHLNLWHIWGISLIINRFTYTDSKTDEDPKKKLGKSIVTGLILGSLALLIGYILKSHI